MKKIITLLCVTFFTLLSCSSDEDTPIIVPSATATQAVLNGGSINVSWPAVSGTGITYNVYRNDKQEKINSAPLTEAKFTDVLTATGSYTYSITVNLSGLESPKGIASEKVVLELPKIRITELNNSEYNLKYEYTYIYDTSNITKLVSIITKGIVTKLSDQTVTVSNSTVKYTYNGDLITKIGSTEYVYNAKNQLTSMIRKKADGSIYFTVNWVYNDNSTVTETSDLAYWGTYVYTYLSGNRVKYTFILPQVGSANYVEISNYFFDTKNTFSKNILGDNNIFTGGINNEVSSSTTGGNETYATTTTSTRSEYTYNANDYVLTKTVYNTTPSTEEQIEKTVYIYN